MPSTPKDYPQAGFALVIALALMSFVVLLLLSISTLVRVETRNAQGALDSLKAEQNALLGLSVALGELQASAGPDSRITAPAELFDADPETEAVEAVANPGYTGVFQAHNNDQPLETFRIGQNTPSDAIRWLASSVDPLLDPVTRLPSDFSPETVTLAKVHDGASNSIRDIEAGLVEIIPGESGFAWWVGDEGTKAKLNVIDEGIALAAAEAPFDGDALALVQARQSNFVHVSETFERPFGELIDDGTIEKLISEDSIALLSTDWEDWFYREIGGERADLNQDVTLVARGLPVDVTQGRLKEDLTVYLETGLGLDDDDHIVRGGPGDTDYGGPDFGLQLTSNPLSDNLPRFGVLRSWNDLGKQYGQSGLATHQPQSNTVHGLHPIVMRAGFSLSAGRVGNPVEDPIDPSNMLVDLQPIIFVRVALWNPYNFPLPPEQYLFEISLPDRLLLQWTQNGNRVSSDPQSADSVELVHFINDGVINRDSYAWHGDRPWLRMILDTGNPLLFNSGMLPGETLNFSPEIVQSPLTQAIYEDRDASAYQSGDGINYANPIDDEFGSTISGFFVLGPPVTVSIPKDPAFFPSETPRPPDRWYTLRYQRSGATNGLDQGLSWRLNLLRNGDPLLLASKDPTKMERPVGFQNGYSLEGRRTHPPSRNFDRIKRLDNLPDSSTRHDIRSDMVDYWYAAAREGGARQGGGRRNALRNPRGGILRDQLDGSNWGAEDHRISVYGHENFENYWAGPRWRRETDPVSGNLGTVEGFVRNPIDNATAFLTGTRYAFFDFPRRFGPITSLGQMQHASLNPFGFGSAHQVGFSRAPAHVPRDTLSETSNTSLTNERIDLPFVLNASLWDRFYLSTIPQSDALALDPSAPPTLSNNRHLLVPGSQGNFPGDNDLRASTEAFERSAANIQVDGAFNVNSVSVDAWEGVLLEAAGKTIPTERDGPLNSGGNAEFVAFPRFPDPVYGPEDDDAFDQLDPQDSGQHAGIFVTDRDDIRILAENIVAEIKRRGPFLSLADFINRRLIDDSGDLDIDYQGLMGTLDAAIMRASQTDDVLNHQQIFGRTGAYNQNLDPRDPSGSLPFATDAESAYGVPRGHEATALEGNPANLTQADILQLLGPRLSARSDTFRIRSAGNSGGRTVRCEAIVQRIAEPVDPTDPVVSPQGPFGRRFVIVDFRWLEDDS